MSVECFLLFIFSYKFLYALIFPVISPIPTRLVTPDFSTLLIFSKGYGFRTFLSRSGQHYTHDISQISELNTAAVADAASQTKLACNGALQSVSLLQLTLPYKYFLKESRNFDIQLLKIPRT